MQTILAPVAEILQKLDEQRNPSTEPITIYRSRLWFTTAEHTLVPEPVKSILSLTESEFRPSVEEKIQVTSDSIFTIENSHVSARTLAKHLSANPMLGLVAIYQAPTTDGTTPRVLIMETDGGEGIEQENLINFQVSE